MSLTPAAAEILRQAALTRRLIDGGITVITPNGNTGESYALSQAEARQVIETAAGAASHRAELLAGVGHDIATAVESAGWGLT